MFDYSAASSQAALEYKLYLLNNAMDEDDISTRIRLKSKDSDRFINMRDVYSTNTECKLSYVYSRPKVMVIMATSILLREDMVLNPSLAKKTVLLYHH